MDNCKKCGEPRRVLGGCSAHESNWYCARCDYPQDEIDRLRACVITLETAGREYLRVNDKGQYRDSGGFDPGLSHAGEKFKAVLDAARPPSQEPQ